MFVLAAGGREESARPHKDPHVPLLQDLDPQGSVVDNWSFHKFRRHIPGEIGINHFPSSHLFSSGNPSPSVSNSNYALEGKDSDSACSQVPTNMDPNHWVKRGVALFLALAY